MKRNIILLMMVLFISITVFADITDLVAAIDKLHIEYKHQEAVSLIENSLSKATTAKEKAELYWRLSRALLFLGDVAEEAKKAKTDVLAIFIKAEEAAEQTIQFDPANPNGYYWKSSSMGRWGQVKGVMDSLAKAEPMHKLLEKTINIDTEYCKAFQVLAMLYEALPGWPISFGNIDYSVSLSRKALDLHRKEVAAGKKDRIDYTYYKELAVELYKRNANAATRSKAQQKIIDKYSNTKDVLKKNFYFEAAVAIPNQSDREEAVILIQSAINALEKKSDKSKYEEKDLLKCKDILKKWGK